MNTRLPDSTSFLTEGEQRIADQLRKFRDLQARRELGSGADGQPLQFSGILASATQVKDSHDR